MMVRISWVKNDLKMIVKHLSEAVEDLQTRLLMSFSFANSFKQLILRLSISNRYLIQVNELQLVHEELY